MLFECRLLRIDARSAARTQRPLVGRSCRVAGPRAYTALRARVNGRAMMARMRCGFVLVTAGLVVLFGCKGEKNPGASGSGEGGASAGAGASESAGTTAVPAEREGEAPAEKSDEAAPQPADESEEMTVLYVKVPGAMTGADRSKFEDPLSELLKDEALGEFVSVRPVRDVTGRQSSTIEIDVYDADKAVPRIVSKLKELGVPAGTVIEQKKPVRKTYPVE